MLQDKQEYLNHIKDENEIINMRKILDIIERVIFNHSTEVSDFLNPYQRRLAYSILNRFIDIKYHEEGGYEEAERKVIVVYPDYLQQDYIDFSISAIKVWGNFKFSDISHKDYLGSVLGLGIKRDKIGDIIVHDEYAYIIVHKDLLTFINMNLENIGRESVKTKEVKISDIEKPQEEYKIIKTTVSSMRLDNIISSSYNMSRNNSSKIIKSGNVKVNWEPIDNISFDVEIGDLISIRKYGRVKIKDVLGESKKGRLKIMLKKYI